MSFNRKYSFMWGPVSNIIRMVTPSCLPAFAPVLIRNANGDPVCLGAFAVGAVCDQVRDRRCLYRWPRKHLLIRNRILPSVSLCVCQIVGLIVFSLTLSQRVVELAEDEKRRPREQ